MKYVLSSCYIYSVNEKDEVVIIDLNSDSNDYLKLEGAISKIFIEMVEKNISSKELESLYDSKGIQSFTSKLLELGIVEESKS